ncbi:MAG: hypothetical protein E7661_04540 [Ruminococcaceae bacterium]|nr:hypothetical protein [Oscillospiraceae bacterium]
MNIIARMGGGVKVVSKYMLQYLDFLTQDRVYTFEAESMYQACEIAEAYLQALEADFIRRHAKRKLRPGRKWYRAIQVAKIE